jgi:hypothetical protein
MTIARRMLNWLFRQGQERPTGLPALRLVEVAPRNNVNALPPLRIKI